MSAYTEEEKDNFIIREFAEDVSDEELVWHRDKKSRVVIPMKCDGWMFQKDNQQPEEMLPNVAIFIEAETYHRIIKGSGPLVIKIIEE